MQHGNAYDSVWFESLKETYLEGLNGAGPGTIVLWGSFAHLLLLLLLLLKCSLEMLS